MVDDVINFNIKFLSTPSARRATDHPGLFSRGVDISIHALREEGDSELTATMPSCENFYPRPPRGGRPDAVEAKVKAQQISIHALREEGDDTMHDAQAVAIISIHALREEGDNSPVVVIHVIVYFYPRPPRGGRPANSFQRFLK